MSRGEPPVRADRLSGAERLDHAHLTLLQRELDAPAEQAVAAYALAPDLRLADQHGDPRGLVAHQESAWAERSLRSIVTLPPAHIRSLPFIRTRSPTMM